MLLNHFLDQSTERNPERIAVRSKGNQITYAELNALANRFGNGLMANGFERQQRAAIYLENSIESALSLFGILKANGVFLVINPQVKRKKLEYILNDCQVQAIITDSNGIQQFSKDGIECPHLTSVFVSDYDIGNESLPSSLSFNQPDSRYAIHSFSDFIGQYPDSEAPSSTIDIDLASLLYTSGSTGDPKGVMLTHHNMVTAATSIVQYIENEPDDIILNYLPLSFDYGLYQLLMAVKFGGTVVLERAFVYPYQAVQAIQKGNITGLPLVPAMAALLLQMKDIQTYDFSRVRYLTNTGQALPPAHIFELQKIFSNARIYSMYGLTECKRVSYLHPSELPLRPRSVGKAIPNTETWIIDKQGNKITTPWTVGELVIRGSHVMKGYWNKPEATAAILKPGMYPDEKILTSGDYFQMDEDGFLYFISRKDDIIKSGGERISPKEIEDTLYELDGVSEVAVIGVPDEILGNAIKAFLVFRDGAEKTKTEIIHYCQDRLEHSRVPKHIEIRDSLPKSSSGKIKKKDLYPESTVSS